MIGNIIKGRSFGTVVSYAATKDKARYLGGNLVGETPKTISLEFDIVWDLNPSVSKAVFHASLSLSIGEHLLDEQWHTVAKDYLKGMDLSKNQYVAYIHQDRPHEHIHIIANRIRLDGSTVSDSFDFSRSDKVIRNLEQKYGLTPTISSKDILRRSQPTGELRQLERTGEESIRARLQDLIDQTTDTKQTMPEFITRLKEVGVNSKVTLTTSSQIRGISYELNGQAFSGTHLGRGYTWTGLMKHKEIEYDPSMHNATLVASSLAVIHEDLRSLSERVLDKAKKFLIRLASIDALKKNKKGQSYYTGPRRTIVWAEKESRLSIYDNESKEELLRVILGEKPIYQKETLTETDSLILDEALEILEKMSEKTKSTKHTQEDSLKIG